MKLVRFEVDGFTRVGVVLGDRVVPVTAYPTMLSLIEAGADGLARVTTEVEGCEGAVPLASVRLLAPIERPGKYLAIGMNYAKHLAEADKLGVARAAYQTWFNKQVTCISGPYDDIEPGVTQKLDTRWSLPQ